MKIKLLLALWIFCSFGAFAQMSCCSKPSATEAFAMLTKDWQFVRLHLEPEPFMLTAPKGKEIFFKTPDGKDGYGYEIKAVQPTNKYVFVIHEWWGLNDYIRQEAEWIYDTLGNVNVIALDLYDKKVASTRDSAAKYMGAMKKERGEAIIKGALNYAGKKAEIATIGWCFGGGWSLQAGILAGKRGKACVIYYGMPEEDKKKLKELQAPVLFIWPKQDKHITIDVVANFQANMLEIGKKVEVLTYDADHAFANPSNPKYNKEYSADAWKHAIAFIESGLR